MGGDQFLEILQSAGSIVLYFQKNDAEIKQRLRVGGFKLERLTKLRYSFVCLPHVIQCGSEIRPDANVLRLNLKRLGVPVSRILELLLFERKETKFNQRIKV